MTRLELAISVLNLVRSESDPPVGRYCVILAVAHQPGISLKDLTAAIGSTHPPSGIVDCMIRKDLVASRREGNTRYLTLTGKGEEEAARLLKGKPFVPQSSKPQPATTT